MKYVDDEMMDTVALVETHVKYVDDEMMDTVALLFNNYKIKYSSNLKGKMFNVAGI